MTKKVLASKAIRLDLTHESLTLPQSVLDWQGVSLHRLWTVYAMSLFTKFDVTITTIIILRAFFFRISIFLFFSVECKVVDCHKSVKYDHSGECTPKKDCL